MTAFVLRVPPHPTHTPPAPDRGRGHTGGDPRVEASAEMCSDGNCFLSYATVSTSNSSAVTANVIGRSDDLDRLRIVLLRLSRRIRANSVGELTPSQFSLFVAVAKHGPLPVGRVAELEHVKPPTASKIIAKLDDRGLVQRTADPDDRRCALIEVSAAGREYIDEVRAAGRSWLAGQLAELDDADLATLNVALPALERLLAADS